MCLFRWMKPTSGIGVIGSLYRWASYTPQKRRESQCDFIRVPGGKHWFSVWVKTREEILLGSTSKLLCASRICSLANEVARKTDSKHRTFTAISLRQLRLQSKKENYFCNAIDWSHNSNVLTGPIELRCHKQIWFWLSDLLQLRCSLLSSCVLPFLGRQIFTWMDWRRWALIDAIPA